MKNWKKFETINSHFITETTNLSTAKIFRKYFMEAHPQLNPNKTNNNYSQALVQSKKKSNYYN